MRPQAPRAPARARVESAAGRREFAAAAPPEEMDPCSLATLRRSQLELGDEIGRGAFSTVFRGTLVATDGAPPLLVAIKKLVVARRDLDRHLQSELELLGCGAGRGRGRKRAAACVRVAAPSLRAAVGSTARVPPPALRPQVAHYAAP